MKEFWNERYGGTAYVYGTEPNAWFAEQLAQLAPGRLLLPAEGEGRNAVHAARAGWDVTAFDISEAGRNKAIALAVQHGVTLDYHIGSLAEIPTLPGDFDALGLVFAHFPATIRASLTGELLTHLRPGAVVIFEAFAKAQLSYQAIHQSGGPQQADMLYSVEEVHAEFPGVEFHRLEEVELELREGAFHHGLARVVRGLGVKR